MPKRPLQPPMINYTMKLMLLEAMRCRADEDIAGLSWIQQQLAIMAQRYKEIERRKPKPK